MFQKILVANRGEIAIRAIRAAQELGAQTVAVFPLRGPWLGAPGACRRGVRDRRAGSPRTRLPRPGGDRRGCGQRRRRCDLPGYGFLSENPDLAEACERAGITFIGPPRQVLELTGNKASAIAAAKAAGVPTLKSVEPSADVDELMSASDVLTYPLFVKAVAGGGGRGMRRVDDPAKLRESIEAAMREADGAFGDPTCFIEEAVVDARHIEVQILADQQRQRRAPARAGLLGAAPAPEGRRDRPGAQPRSGDPQGDVRRRGQVRRVDQLLLRRHRRVPARRRRPLRLHRDEPAHPGRAHRDRGGHQRRPRAGADADRRRRRPWPSSTSPTSRRSRREASRCSAASRRRTRPTASAPTPARSPPTARRADRAYASTAARPSPAPSSARTSTRCCPS